MSQESCQTAEQAESEAAARLLSLRQSPLSLPLNVYSSVNQRPFFSPLILIMEEIFPQLACKPIILHSVSRSNYAWNLIFKSWCPIHLRQHAQQHWTIFQYHQINNGDACQWVMCFCEPKHRVRIQGIPFYDELENNKDY